MGFICSGGICFVLGWHDISEDEAIERLKKLCSDIKNNDTERCKKCDTQDCVVKDDNYKMCFFFTDSKSHPYNCFTNFQMRSGKVDGWIIEYLIDCDDLYFDIGKLHSYRSRFAMINKGAMDKVASIVRDALSIPELQPIPFLYTWRG